MATITSLQARNVASMQRPEGREKLAEYLKWERFDEEDDFRRSILLDYHYDNLMFATKKGFPWSQVVAAFQLAKEMLEETKGKSLAEAIKLYGAKCRTCQNSISRENLKTFTDFFFDSFMTHYSLYQYVFSQDQDKRYFQVDAEVGSPPEPLPFAQGRDISVWEYEQKIEDLEQKDAERKVLKQQKKSDMEKADQELLDAAYKELDSTETPFSRESLKQVITHVASAHSTAASHIISTRIEDTFEELDFKFDKTVVPRPQILATPTNNESPDEEEAEEAMDRIGTSLGTIKELPGVGRRLPTRTGTRNAKQAAVRFNSPIEESPPPRYSLKTPQNARQKSSKASAGKDKLSPLVPKGSRPTSQAKSRPSSRAKKSVSVKGSKA